MGMRRGLIWLNGTWLEGGLVGEVEGLQIGNVASGAYVVRLKKTSSAIEGISPLDSLHGCEQGNDRYQKKMTSLGTSEAHWDSKEVASLGMLRGRGEEG